MGGGHSLSSSSLSSYCIGLLMTFERIVFSRPGHPCEGMYLVDGSFNVSSTLFS